jgi:aspartyl-tRNA(Asn)/glutamyl-tRNA(Gln) amidotransferase subunit A
VTALHQFTLTELRSGLERGDFSSTALTEALLGRIGRHGAELNAFISVLGEPALRAAARADADRSAGNAGPHSGLPLVHKVIFCTQEGRTSCG